MGRLVRVRWAGDGREVGGTLVLGRGTGRGAWLCREHPVECLDLAARRRALVRALRREISEGDLLALRAKLMSTIEK